MILAARIAGLRWLSPFGPFGLGWRRCLSSVSAWRRMRLCPSGRDRTLYGHRRVATRHIRPRGTLAVMLGLRLALRWCLLSRWMLELLAHGRLRELVAGTLDLGHGGIRLAIDRPYEILPRIPRS